MVNEVILFAQRQSHKIRELVYSFEKDGWVAPDLTILAAHIAGEGFAETAFAQQPDAIYWATNKDGELVGMTYERDQNVVGWHRHNTDGKFESVASIYGGDKADEIWLAVQREAAEFVAPYWTAGTVYNDGEYVSVSNVPYAGPHAGEAPPDRTTYKCLVDHTSAHFGNDFVAGKWVQQDIALKPVRYIERFDPNFRPSLEAEDKINYWYLDCGFRSGGSTKVGEISGVGHLEGRTVGVLGDGANQPTREVIGGKVDVQDPAKMILVGLPFTSIVKPMNLNIPADDTMQGRKVRIHKLVARFYKSLTCKFSTDGVKWDEIFFRDRDDKMDTSPSVFSGDREVHTNANFKPQQAVSIRQDRPFPCCVLAMICWADSYGE